MSPSLCNKCHKHWAFVGDESGQCVYCLGLEKFERGNVGHGHVYPRPDGVRARCGGEAFCNECAKDAAEKALALP